MLFFRFPKTVWAYVKKHPPFAACVRVFICFLIVFILFAALFQFAEQKGWFIAVWMSWETLSTVGFGDFPAITLLGRIFTMIAGSIGIAVMSAAIGAGVVLFTYIDYRRRSGLMKNPHKDGYVLFNFPGTQNALAFITEVREVEPKVGICFVDNSLEELPASIMNMGDVHFVRGSGLDIATYERANVHNNKVAVVFPSDQNNADSDGNTRTVVSLLNDYIKDNTVRILHVLVDPQHSWMFKSLPSTEILQNLELFALVQECQDEYSALIIERLLKNSEDANQQTVVIDLMAGKTWQELQITCAITAGTLNEQINILALVRDGNVQTCPKGTEMLRSGDILSIITFNGFDWKSFERAMAQ